jgi:hypothetical protein
MMLRNFRATCRLLLRASLKLKLPILLVRELLFLAPIVVDIADATSQSFRGCILQAVPDELVRCVGLSPAQAG